ncbi:MAG: DMT family transporter [Planctomycetes bacterium]|nr:DMT family transporter [Planctomycetota bacterium]
MELIKGRVFVAAAFILAGSSVVAAGALARFLPPFTITFLRLVFAAQTAFAVRGTAMLRIAAAIAPAGRRILFLQAVFGVMLFRVFLTLSLQFTSAAEAGIMTGTAPAITAIFTYLLLRESHAIRTVIGVAGALAGILVMHGFPFATGLPRHSHLLGNFLALCATACESLFAVLSRRMLVSGANSVRLDPVTHAGIVSIIALFLCLPLFFLESPFPLITMLPASAWLGLAYYGAIVTVLAYAFMFAGAKRCGGYTISAFTGIIPASALIFSIAVLGETVSPDQWIGFALIMLSIMIASLEKKTGMRT